ncbi:CAF17-like 4Fe-4S cluster assembly/insertion protein YgfZ [Deefgea rivuli]|uniref:CAF17-like 4Fe-4S cluster assembly/insertion protein YgfZ n=1 Tax=Deefgea rivuli TaxID=400948 RepID=UPI00055B9A3E|nr:folate-binding protein YgfZ [Deefgea rivuli]
MDWNQFLLQAGAQIENEHSVLFGTAETELAALETKAICCPLLQYGLIRFQGEESQVFLQGQLSSDVRALTLNSAQYSSYSTPKGRMQASFLVSRQGDDYLLQIAAELQAAIQKRLAMFVMRSKTKASDANAELVQVGVAGPTANALIITLFGTAPAAFEVQHHANASVIGLEGARFQIIASPAVMPSLWAQLLENGAIPAGTAAWQLTEIRAGAPWITAATQEDFVPQMANMELIGGVSFTKGCYPGQEIVARTQYLGKLKRRTYRMHVDSLDVQAGQDVYSPEMNGQASGKIMLAAPAPQGGSEVLVVAQIASVEHGLHLQDSNGPQLTPLSLPYSLN